MPVLAVGGCSYSDYTNVDKVYGEFCAEQLGFEYKHYARGGSGNQRMFYILTRAIQSGEIGKGDIVVLQYTDPHRKLLPEPFKRSAENGPGQTEVWDTPYGEGYTTDYKEGSWQYQNEPQTVAAHKALNEFCINNEFETDYVMVLNSMFEAFAKQHGVEIVPFYCRFVEYIEYKSIAGQLSPSDMAGPIRSRLAPYLQNRMFCELDFVRVGNIDEQQDTDLGMHTEHDVVDGERVEREAYDGSHLSVKGHQLIGTELAAHIKRHKVLDSI
jgi:hypothetical protein